MLASTINTDQLRVRSTVMSDTNESENLLSFLPRSSDAVAWLRHGEGMVGWGEVARCETSGPDRFDHAEQWWQSFASSLEIHPSTQLKRGPIAFLSMAFADHPGHSTLIVPHVVIGRSGNILWRTDILPERTSSTDNIFHQPAWQPVQRPTGVRYRNGQFSAIDYHHAAHVAVNRIRDGELVKAVLAHDLVAVTDQPIDARYLLQKLAKSYSDCWTFSVAGLVGATPELLLRRRGEHVNSRVLAGTRWPQANLDEEMLINELLASHKDRAEHTYAVESFIESIRPLCTTLFATNEPEVLRLRNVLHLATAVRGRLNRTNGCTPSLLQLAKAIHPTAAVGGTPRTAALQLINELEKLDRGRYSGPVGWMDDSGNGELGIALRCAELSGNTARLFAGCGLVADSDPATEVQEAAAKLIPIKDALASSED